MILVLWVKNKIFGWTPARKGSRTVSNYKHNHQDKNLKENKLRGWVKIEIIKIVIAFEKSFN